MDVTVTPASHQTRRWVRGGAGVTRSLGGHYALTRYTLPTCTVPTLEYVLYSTLLYSGHFLVMGRSECRHRAYSMVVRLCRIRYRGAEEAQHLCSVVGQEREGNHWDTYG